MSGLTNMKYDKTKSGYLVSLMQDLNLNLLKISKYLNKNNKSALKTVLLPSVNLHLWIYKCSDEPDTKLLSASLHSHYWSHLLLFTVLPFSLVHSQQIITATHISVLALLIFYEFDIAFFCHI